MRDERLGFSNHRQPKRFKMALLMGVLAGAAGLVPAAGKEEAINRDARMGLIRGDRKSVV